MRPFYLGDFHQLTDETGAGTMFGGAWQCDRPDLKAGFAIVFVAARLQKSPRTFKLGGNDPDAVYEVEFYGGSKKNVKGSELESCDRPTQAPVVPTGVLPEAESVICHGWPDGV